MRLNTKAFGVLLSLALVAACSGGSQWTGTVTDSAGVTIVTNTAEGTWTEAERWTLEEEIRIGSVEGDLNYQFGQVGTIGVDSKGALYVSDIQAQQIKVYSVDGGFLRTIGRPGAGPGELGPGAAFVLLAPGDTLLVPDIQNRRINRYAPDGTNLESVPLEVEKGIPMQYNVTPTGTMTVQVRPLALPDRPVPDSVDAIVILQPSGTFADTIFKLPSGGTINLGGSTPELNLFSPEPLWDVTDSLTVLYGMNNDYRIGMYDRDGSLERVFSKPFEQTQVGDRDKELIFSFLDRAWTDAGVPPAVLPQLHNIVHFGEFYPAFSSFQTGYRGTIWVQQIQLPTDLTDEEMEQFNLIEESGSPDWDVFDGDGKYLGVVTMPSRFQPRILLGDKIYGVWRDELDVQYVMRLRIVEG